MNARWDVSFNHAVKHTLSDAIEAPGRLSLSRAYCGCSLRSADARCDVMCDGRSVLCERPFQFSSRANLLSTAWKVQCHHVTGARRKIRGWRCHTYCRLCDAKGAVLNGGYKLQGVNLAFVLCFPVPHHPCYTPPSMRSMPHALINDERNPRAFRRQMLELDMQSLASHEGQSQDSFSGLHHGVSGPCLLFVPDGGRPRLTITVAPTQASREQSGRSSNPVRIPQGTAQACFLDQT